MGLFEPQSRKGRKAFESRVIRDRAGILLAQVMRIEDRPELTQEQAGRLPGLFYDRRSLSTRGVTRSSRVTRCL